LRYNNTTDYKFSGFSIAGLGTELFPFKNGCCYWILRWYFNCIYFGGQLAFKTIFFSLFKNTSIHGQKVLNPFFVRQIVLLSAIYTFLFSSHNQPCLKKNSIFRLPTFQINFIIIDQIYLHY